MTQTARRAASRERILSAAATAFRGRGYAATGVDAVMSAAGLTHGGFYAHFPSKSALLEATIDHLREPANMPLVQCLAGLAGPALIAAAIERYLSAWHRDHPHEGCAIPTLGAELPRLAEGPTQAVAPCVSGLARKLAPHLDGDPGTQEQRAQALVALLVGGVISARALPATESDMWLASCRQGARRLANLPPLPTDPTERA